MDKLAEDLKDYDLDEYLPPVTLAWCYWKMREQGFNPGTMTQMDESTSGTGVKDHGQVYMKLRYQVRLYISLNELPVLTETEVPRGAYTWKPSSVAVEAFHRALNLEKIYQELMLLSLSTRPILILPKRV